MIRASTNEMIIRYKVKWGHSPTPNRTRRVDRPALLTTRINVFPSQPDKGTKEHPLIAHIATKYFLDQGCILFHKNSADFMTC